MERIVRVKHLTEKLKENNNNNKFFPSFKKI